MAMGGVGLIFMLAMGSNAGNELLDFIGTDVFWTAGGTAISVDTMAEEITKTAPQKTGGGTTDDMPDMDKMEQTDAKQLLATSGGKALRRLMAIRTLGELKDKKGLPALQPLLESKEPFVAEYAARAVAAINGRKYTATRDTASLRNDPWLMPGDIAAIGQLKTKDGPPVSLEKLVSDSPLAAMMGTPEARQQMLDRANTTLIKLTCFLGNIRLDAITGGLSGNIRDNPDRGYGVIIFRGEYDAERIADLIEDNSQAPPKLAGDVKIYQPERELYLMTPADNVLVLVPNAGEKDNPVPIEKIAAAVATGKKQLSATSEIGKLLKETDTASPAWGVMTMTENIKNQLDAEMAPLKALDTYILTTAAKGTETMAITLTAAGDDETTVDAAAAYIRGKIQEGVQEIEKNPAPPQMASMQNRIVNFMKSIDIETKDRTATLKAEFEAPGMMGMYGMLPWLLMARAAPAQAAPPPPPGN